MSHRVKPIRPSNEETLKELAARHAKLLTEFSKGLNRERVLYKALEKLLSCLPTYDRKGNTNPAVEIVNQALDEYQALG